MSGVLSCLAKTSTSGVSLTATADPGILDGRGRWEGPSTIRTRLPTSVFVVGGTPPYTYDWNFVSGSAEIYAETPVDNSTYFSAYLVDFPQTETAIWSCTVTDALSNTATTNSVSVSLSLR